MDKSNAPPMQSTSGRILALIPAYNAAHLVGPVIEAASKHLPVLAVDDGSTDDTAAVAEAAGAILLRQPRNQGKGAALQAGFRHALAEGYDAVITLDADGQHDPVEIPTFLARFAQTDADLIIGARDFTVMPLSRRIANTLGARAISWGMRTHIRDNQSGYRLVSRRLIEDTLQISQAGFELEVEQIMIAVEKSYRLEWVPIQTIYNDAGSHIRPLQHIRGFVRMVMEARRRSRGLTRA